MLPLQLYVGLVRSLTGGSRTRPYGEHRSYPPFRRTGPRPARGRGKSPPYRIRPNKAKQISSPHPSGLTASHLPPKGKALGRIAPLSASHALGTFPPGGRLKKIPCESSPQLRAAFIQSSTQHSQIQREAKRSFAQSSFSYFSFKKSRSGSLGAPPAVAVQNFNAFKEQKGVFP